MVTSTGKRKRRKCSHINCDKIDAGRGFCVRHGGGRKCNFQDCTKGAQAGGFCRTHGGGARCRAPNCNKVDAGRGFCRRHGGGKRCMFENCTKSDIGGGFCSAHGGGRKCSEDGCEKVSQGGGKCWSHGIRRRCKAPKCRRHVEKDMEWCLVHALEVDTGVRTIDSPPQKQHVQGPVHSTSPGSDQSTSIVSSDDVSGSNAEQAGCCSKSLGSRIDSGCATSFGGECNCPPNCTCCSHNKQSSPTKSIHPATSYQSPKLELRRLVISFSMPEEYQTIPEDIFISMVRGIEGVRSVHKAGNTFDPLPMFVLYTDPTLKASAVINAFKWTKATCEIEEATTVAWTYRQVVLSVRAMMCAGNCGSTVVNAASNVPNVESATLDFPSRRIITRGRMLISELQSAVGSAGFESQVAQERAIPMTYKYIRNGSISAEPDRFRQCLLDIHRVESVMVVNNEVIVSAFLDDDHAIVQEAAVQGFELIIQGMNTNAGDTMDGREIVGKADESSVNSLLEFADGHTCDREVCERNQCAQYMARLAHEAAYAIGWSVPGCAMQNGGQCNCGDDCACPGCETHDND